MLNQPKRAAPLSFPPAGLVVERRPTGEKQQGPMAVSPTHAGGLSQAGDVVAAPRNQEQHFQLAGADPVACC